MRRLGWLIAVIGVASGCGVTVNAHPLNTPPHALLPLHEKSVQVYTASKPRDPYVEIAMIEARQESAFAAPREQEVFRALRKKAAQMGCEGLILLGAADSVQSSASGWDLLAGGLRNRSVHTLHGYRATCIVWDESGDTDEDDVPMPRKRAAPPAAPPAPTTAAATACEPPCSPGYTCVEGACAASCNPPCPAGQVCGGDRICRANRAD